MAEEKVSSVQAAIDAGMLLSENLTEVDGISLVLLPAGAKVHSLESFMLKPTRKKGEVVLRDAESFIRFINTEKTDDTNIYGDVNKLIFKAVINDHGNEPGWRDYFATYACPVSKEWSTWLLKNGMPMNQETFATFIEDNLPDIAEPPAAEMLEISRSLEAKKKVNFASGIRLSDGQNELTYEEEISGTASKGKLKVPETFTIGIPVLEGGTRYAAVCRLRYRIGEGGKLTMWYDMLRPYALLDDAVKAIRGEIEVETELMVFNGSP